MTPSRPSPGSQAGFTIVESMVASVLLLVGLVATLTVLTQASATTGTTRTREQATNLQRELVEAARSVSFDKLTQNGLGDAVRTRPGLGVSSVGSAGWTIKRRNVTYTVSMGVCTVDDPRDGIGPHPAGVHCAEGAPPTAEQCASYISASVLGQLPGAGAGVGANLGQCGIDVDLDGTVDGLVNVTATVCLLTTCPKLDENPTDYKRIVSLVRWPGGYNLQTSQVNNPGSAAAPAVTSLTPATNPVTAAAQTSLTLASTTTNSPKTVALYRDGNFIGNASPSGGANSWTANWDLGRVSASQPEAGEVVDGTYELSEKAFSDERQLDASGQLRQYGQYGATYTQTVVVDRRKHFAPAHVEAGRNGSAVEIEWSPAREKDSKGFRVYRRFRDAVAEVCSLAVRTACRDASPPSAGILDTLEYFVVGCDRSSCLSSNVGEGDRSESTKIPYSTPPAPGTPQSLQASLENGNVKLTWTAPGGLLTSPPDHYNVYRTVQGAGEPSYSDRLDSVYIAAGQPLAYTDTRTTGQVHDYWVTAVNSNLGESAKLGKVTR